MMMVNLYDYEELARHRREALLAELDQRMALAQYSGTNVGLVATIVARSRRVVAVLRARFTTAGAREPKRVAAKTI